MLKYHIQTIDLSSAQAFVQFNAIPQDYSDLIVLMSARSSQSSRSTAITVAFNNDNSGSYSFVKLIGYDSSQVYAGSGSGTPAQVPEIDVTGNSATANTFGNTSFYITNYTGAIEKSVVVEQSSENNSSSAYVLGINSYRYSSTNPITSIQFGLQGHNYMAGSSISLYGVKRGSDGRTEVASGGVISTSGGYTIHTFNTSGTFVANRNLNAEYIVVAGGGGGGRSYYGAGGGAGGYRSSVIGEMSGGGATSESLISLNSGQSYAVAVGAGGPSFTNGSDTSFAGVVSVGGGRGGSENTSMNGNPGGSGGGAALNAGVVGPGTTNQGFPGGKGNDPAINNASGGGGGGAGSAGVASVGYVAGNGGNGVTSSISGTATARAGGGGGAGFGSNTYTQGLGQAGGGNGALDAANAGAVNTGSGGGGRGRDTSGTLAGAGGSGVVIIRYLTP